MWLKMMAFGATASILALSACASSEDEYAEDADSAIAEDGIGEAPLAAKGGEQPYCGGKGGIVCPAGSSCQDNPNDGCDPALGGMDCGGTCVADRRQERKPNPSACRRHDPDKSYVSRNRNQCRGVAFGFVCEEGERAFYNECGCGCETVVEEPCGDTVCGPGTSCCNPLCGICVRPGMVCHQGSCNNAGRVVE